MTKFSVDYNQVSSCMNKKVFKTADISGFKRVAFDLFKVASSNSDELWQIQDADDGTYIVAKYTDDAEETKKEASKNWNVTINKTSGDVNLFYNDTHITKFASKDFGLGMSDLDAISRFLPKKLSEDKNLAKALLSYITPSEREQLLKLCPELSK